MATFTWVPDQGAKGTHKPRLKQAQFGDGYVQSSPDGINNIERTHALNFTLLNLATYQAIMAFLENQNGAAFDWTTPSGTTGRFVCEEWSDDAYGVTYSISATFKQVWGK